jgi:hypothetical protein
MSRLLIASGLRVNGVLLNFKWRASGWLRISDILPAWFEDKGDLTTQASGRLTL